MDIGIVLGYLIALLFVVSMALPYLEAPIFLLYVVGSTVIYTFILFPLMAKYTVKRYFFPSKKHAVGFLAISWLFFWFFAISADEDRLYYQDKTRHICRHCD